MLKTLALSLAMPIGLAVVGYIIGGEVAAGIMGVLGVIIGNQTRETGRLRAEVDTLKVRMLDLELGKISGEWAAGIEQRLDDEVRLLNNEIERTQRMIAS